MKEKLSKKLRYWQTREKCSMCKTKVPIGIPICDNCNEEIRRRHEDFMHSQLRNPSFKENN